MAIRFENIDSVDCNSGTYQTDQGDFFAPHFTCPGRLPHPTDEPLSVFSIVGTTIEVQPSAYMVYVDRIGATGNVSSFDTVPVKFSVTATEYVSFSGDGALILRIPQSSVNIGVATSANGNQEGYFEFIAGAADEADVQSAVGSDGFLVLSYVVSGSIVEGEISTICTKGGCIDLGGGCITNLADPVNDTDAVNLQTLNSILTPSEQTIHLEVDSTGVQSILSWNNYALSSGSFEYRIYRSSTYNGAYSLIGTVPSTDLTFTDTAPATNNYYYVSAANTILSYEIHSNTVYVDSSGSLIIPIGYYGDGSDGSFTGGTLGCGVYNFTDVNLTSNMYIDGSVILVQGDFNTNGFDIISNFSDGTCTKSVSYNSNNYNLSQSSLVPASGGTTGSVEQGGDAAPDRISAGEDGDDGRQGGGVIFVGSGGIGGIAPAPTLYPGQDGQDGLPGASVTGASGGGASHGWGHTPSMFFVGANYNNSGSNIIGVGADGGVGGNGIPANNFGGAGGGGGQGGDGLTLYINVAGTNTNTASLNLINGVGGAGGFGANGIIPGSNGQAGLDGVNGSIITI